MRINVWSYKEEYNSLKKEILKEVDRCFSSGQLILGKRVKLLEHNFSKYLKLKFGVGVNSGTDALQIALMSAKIGKGDEVITVSNTAVPTISAIVSCGATPVFVDISMRTLAINPRLLENKITEKTKCIFLTHAQGYNGLNEEILDIVKEKNIWLIEDVCESHGAQYNNKKLGCFGNLSNFSLSFI